MTKVMEKIESTSELARFEAQLLKRTSYRKIHAETETVSRIAAKLIRFRQAHSLTQIELAKAAKISRKAINEIEGLVNTNPNLRTLEAIASALHMPIGKLLA